MSYRGDFALGATVDFKFTTRRFTTGVPFALASGVISAYPDNSTTQLTAGITLSADFDGVVGLNNVRVVASGGNGYATGTSYALVITTGTVDSVSVVGEVIGEFTLERSPAFARLGAPAGASVSADVAAVKDDTAAVKVKTDNLPPDPADASVVAGLIAAVETKVDTIDTVVDNILVDTAEIGAAGAGLTAINLPNQTMDIVGNITGNLSGSVGSVTGAVGSVTGAVGSVTGLTAATVHSDLDDIQARLPAALVSGRMDASVGAMAANVVTAAALATDASAEIADAVWDEAMAGHVAAGSTGEGLADAGGAGTPPTVGEIADAVWDEATAGLIDTKTDTSTITSSIDETGGADIDAIKAKTDLLTLAAINAEVVDALATDTYAESAAPPAATASLAAKIVWLATLARNKITQTATTQLVRNDGDSSTVATSTVSDNGTTFTRGKFS